MNKAFLVIFGCMFLLTACAESSSMPEEESLYVKTQTVSCGFAQTMGTYVASIENSEVVEVLPQVSGTVETVSVNVGDYVREGTILCNIDGTAARIAYENAEIGLQSAQAGLKSAMAGLENAQANYDKVYADGEKKLVADHELANYQSEMNIQSIGSDIYHQQEKIDEFRKTTLEDAEKDLKKAKKNKKKAKESGDEEAIAAAKKEQDTAEKALDNAEKSLADMEASLDKLKLSMESAQGQQQLKNGEIYKDEQTAVAGSLEIAQINIDSAKTSVDSASAGVRSAQNKLDDASYKMSLYTLSAPVSGIVEAVYAEKNGFIQSGQVCFVIADPSSKVAVFHVTDDVAGTLFIGQEVYANVNDRKCCGKISEIGVTADETGLFKVKAVMDGDCGLADGISIKLELVIDMTDDLPLIPTDSVYFKDRQAYVYVYKNGRAVKRDVLLEIYGDSECSVSEGLSLGEQIITTWSSRLKDNVAVTPI